MTFFNEVNQNETSSEINNVATGPRVGFMDNFMASYEAQRRASAVFGIERAVTDLNDEQNKKLRELGVVGDMPWEQSTGPWGGDPLALDLARFYEEGGDEESVARYKAYDDKIDELKKKHPTVGLMNSREMWEDVKTKAQEAERNVNTNRTTTLGDVGGFAGAAIASVDPRTDEYNTVTLGLGQVGKNVVTRIAAQAGIQGATEAVNQITGVQEERRLLGLESGFMDGLSRVGFSAVGGGVIQGVGEGIGAGFRYAGKRWFSPGVNDPVPPPPVEMPNRAVNANDPIDVHADNLARGASKYEDLAVLNHPISETRMGKARSMSDVDHITSQLEAWDGDLPINIKPQTSAKMPVGESAGFKLEDFETLKKKMQPISVDARAREIDPKVFSVYDKLTARKEELRGMIADMTAKGASGPQPLSAAETQTIQTAVEDITNRIEDLKAQKSATTLSNKKLKDLDKRITQLETERADNMVRMKNAEGNPEVAALRQELIDTDIKTRDLAETVSRAYARARGEWKLPPEHEIALRQMMRGGQSRMPDVPRPKDAVDNTVFEETLSEKAPILNQAHKVEAKMRPDSDAADYATAIIKDNMKLMDEKLEIYRGSLNKILKEESGEVTIEGTDIKLNLDKDKIYVPNDNGEGGKVMTIREILEENNEAELDLKATKTCST